MAIYTWVSYPASAYTSVMQEGCVVPAIKDTGVLYYNPVQFDPVTGAPMYQAWMRSDRNAATCYESNEFMTIEQFNALDYSDTQG